MKGAQIAYVQNTQLQTTLKDIVNLVKEISELGRPQSE